MSLVSKPVLRFLPLLPVVLAGIVIGMGCQRFGDDILAEPKSETGRTLSISTSDSASSATSRTIGDTLYSLSALGGAKLWYQQELDSDRVSQVEASYSLSQQWLNREFGAGNLAHVDIYLASAQETTRLARTHSFQHPDWLGGFYSFTEGEGHIEGAEVFINAEATSIPQTVGHEMTHLRTPSAPIWFSEGIAEYIGSRVSVILDPLWLEHRTLQARHKVRSSVNEGTLPSFDQLTQFEWNAIREYLLLELIYSESWLVSEFIARKFGEATLFRLALLYEEGFSHSEDPFPQLLGFSANDLLDAFAKDIKENLNEEEMIGADLCAVNELAMRSLNTTDEWNTLSSQNSLTDQNTRQKRVRAIHESWLQLLSNIKAIDSSGDAIAVHSLFTDYFEIMALAFLKLQMGDVSSANTLLGIGNDIGLRSATVMNNEFAARLWLSC